MTQSEIILHNRDTLVANFKLLGIHFLAPSDAQADQILTPSEFMQAIVTQPDARLRTALVTLFLRQPSLAEFVPQIAETLDGEAKLNLQTLYTAAVYLQRLWRTRLGFYLAPFNDLPDYFSQTLSLPPADERFGKVGLYALADAWAERSVFPYNRLASLNKMVELLFAQLKQETKTHEFTPAS